MMIRTEEGGKSIVDYNCPIVEPEDGADVDVQWKQRRIRYRACPRRLAEANGYSREEILKALITFRTYGDGRHIWMDEYTDFSNIALQTREEVRRSWTFKRTAPAAGDDAEGDGQSENEDWYL